MATVTQSLPQFSNPLTWLWGFLKEELAPYPGRSALVARMTLAATLVMIVCMTFRIPFAFQGAIYAFLISRESPRATLQSAAIIAIVTDIGEAYLLVSARFVISIPALHFFWVIASFFLAFYAISAMTDYRAAVIFAIMMSLGIPLWDRHLPAETNVEDTLWLGLSVWVGILITGAVELAFVKMRPGDEVVVPITDRLAAVETLLTCYADGRAVDAATEKQILRLGTLGTSLLRRTLRRSDYSAQYSVEMGGVAALVGRLIDLAATLMQLSFKPSVSDQTRFRNLASTVAMIRNDLMNRRIPVPIKFNNDGQPASLIPLLAETEHTVSLIPEAFADSRSIQEYLPSAEDMRQRKLLDLGALADPEHLQFALRGCLAASVCYVIYNAVAWPGISTAVTTCLLTALSTVGSSRQKQVLRITGAIVGGFLLGMGSQIFILPYIDSIAGFTVLFVAVTALSSWFMTSSPRLSYFGIQVALAFYFINLSEFKMQTSVAVARDRVVGILLGLFMMWLAFDQLWGVPAAVEMRRKFISNLRLLAQFAREPLSIDRKTAIARGIALGETISTNLDEVRALGDGVLLEFGPSREQDLALRDRIRRWQPHMRMLFILQIATWKYGVRLPGFELAEAIQSAREEFDNHLAMALEAMADQMDGNKSTQIDDLTSAYTQLEQAAEKAFQKPQNQLTPQIRSFLVLSRRIADLAECVAKEIC
ncbi:MAG TPA: FUSC family protein [Candidatus Sulfotelmatobacter sp.]|nr:FUSC family protein [Candidatus Sulfotelmatobacter sp.]